MIFSFRKKENHFTLSAKLICLQKRKKEVSNTCITKSEFDKGETDFYKMKIKIKTKQIRA